MDMRQQVLEKSGPNTSAQVEQQSMKYITKDFELGARTCIGLSKTGSDRRRNRNAIPIETPSFKPTSSSCRNNKD